MNPLLTLTSAWAQVAPAEPALTRPPELLTFVEAELPADVPVRTAAVVVAITIAADGTVEDAALSEPAGEPFDSAALDAVRRFRFSPAEIDGVPARIRILYRYEFVERAELPTAAVFQGVVRDRLEKVPLAGVTVTLSDGRAAVTDAEGRFRFDEVPPGLLTVTLEGERLTALQTEETFVAGEQLDATYDVLLADEGDEGDDLEVLIVAPTLKREAVSTEIAAEDARKVPGTQGDVLRVVESLPGVARTSLGTGALVVWGAAPQDTGVYVDGVPVPRLYHDGGLRSVVGSAFVDAVTLVPGGYGAAYGRGLGGLVTVDTRRFDAPVAEVSADLYDGAAAVGGAVGPVSAGVAVRYGWVDRLLGAVAADIEDYFPIPRYHDLQARAGVALGAGETLDVTFLTSSDRTVRTAPSPDPAREAAEDQRLGFERLWVRYARDAGSGDTLSALVYAGQDRASQISRFGATSTAIASDVRLVGGRVAYRARLHDLLTVEGGLDAHVPITRITRTGSVAIPPREGDVRVFGQPPPDRIGADAFTVAQASLAPYVEADLALLADRLHLVPGLRVDPSFRSVSRSAPQVGINPTHGLFLWDPHAEPRLAVRADATPWLGLTGAWGVYGQPPAASDLSASFGNPTLPVPRGQHLLAGAAVRPADGLSLEVTGFRTAVEALAMRNPLDEPATAEALVAAGEGRTVGMQAMARLDPGDDGPGVYGWVSYTLARSDRRGAPDRPWRPSDYDQRHVLTALAGVELPARLEVGARVRVASGFPRTEVTGAYHDSRRDLFQPTFGAHNGVRLPLFFQGDLRVARSFALRRSTLDLSVEVQNVTDRANVEEWIYSADYGARGGIRGLPVLPVLGLRWRL